MNKPVVIIVGADKGGVGKTTVSRALLDYLDSKGIKNRAFDTENEVTSGVLKRFYPDRTEIVDLSDSDGQMKVFDTLGDAVTVIDIRAGLLSPTLTMLAEIGFLDPAKYTLMVLHVLGSSQASIEEVQSITGRLRGVRYIAVGNRINATKFGFPVGALEIPMLDTKACEAVDQASAPFAVFAAGGFNVSSVLSGKVGHWLGRVFAQFAAAKVP
jgi:hypothetical protein